MRPFLIRVLALLGLGLALHLALLIAVTLLNRRAMSACRLGPEVTAVIAGDSHTMWALDDGAIPGLRNISLNAEGYKYTYAKLQHMFAHEPQVTRLYLGVGFHNFSGYFDDYIYGDMLKFFAYRYLGVLSLADFAEIARANPPGVVELSKQLVSSGLIPGLKGRCEFYGAFPEEKKAEVLDLERVQVRLDSQFYRDGQVIAESASNVRYLQAIVDLARRHDVHVVALNTPVHAAYLAGVPQVYRQRLAAFVAENGLEYYDFSDLHLPDAAFLPDGDHLNYDGAMLTTRHFARFHAEP